MFSDSSIDSNVYRDIIQEYNFHNRLLNDSFSIEWWMQQLTYHYTHSYWLVFNYLHTMFFKNNYAIRKKTNWLLSTQKFWEIYEILQEDQYREYFDKIVDWVSKNDFFFALDILIHYSKLTSHHQNWKNDTDE